MMLVTPTNSPSPERVGTDELVERIIDAAQPLFMAQRHAIAKVWQDRSVSKLNLHLLILLDVNGPQTMSQLATLADVALPNLTGIIDRMVDGGLVERERDDNDRRVVVVHSTAKGQSYVEQLESARREGLRQILVALGPSEQEVCLQAMQLMGREADKIKRRHRSEKHDATTALSRDEDEH